MYDIFGILAAGGSIRVASHTDLHHPEKLLEIMCREPVTFWDSAPAALQQLTSFFPAFQTAAAHAPLRLVFLSGDWIPVTLPDAVRDTFPKARVISLGGATEATVWSNFYPIEKVDPAWPSIPYGKPIQNARYYILDADLQPCPIGLPGDLYIGGECLASCYINDSELTNAKFSADPFVSVPGARIYKTGDLARWFPDGNMEFLGRKDFQVKIRGYRIELGEIENQLLKHNRIKETVVIAREDDGDKYLCAYLVGDGKLQHSELREFLLLNLPEYMIPAYFVQLESIPLTGNGKVNRKELPNPKNLVRKAASYVAPRNEPEQIIADIWQEVLGIDKVGIEDNFFELGGDSIKAIRILSDLNKYQLQLELDKLLEHQTISAVSEYIKTAVFQIDQGPVEGVIPLTPVQEWFFERGLAHRHHFNQAVMLYRKEGLDPDAIREIFQRMAEHHDALRMVYDDQNGEIVQYNRGMTGKLFNLRLVDLKNTADAGVKARIETEAVKLQQDLTLAEGPLINLGLFSTDNGDHLQIVIHHLVVDAVSWRIILEDFAAGYKQVLAHQNIQFQSKTTSFKEWSERLQDYASSSELLNELPYWAKLAGTGLPGLPEDQTPESNLVRDGCSLNLIIPKEETAKLRKDIHKAYGTELNDVLLIALALAMKEWAGAAKIMVNLEAHGRENVVPNIDLTHTIGWFTAMYPLILDLSVSDDLSYRIKYLKEMIRRVPNHGIGYGVLRYLTDAARLNGTDLHIEPEICFNYLGDFDQDIQSDLFGISAYSPGEPFSPDDRRLYRLDINCFIAGAELQFTFNYNAHQYREATILKLVDHYRQSLQEIAAHCLGKEQSELTPTDVGYQDLSLEELDYITGIFSE